jgi:argininosuccinate lyase
MLAARGILSARMRRRSSEDLSRVATEYEANGVPEDLDLEDIHMVTESALPS